MFLRLFSLSLLEPAATDLRVETWFSLVSFTFRDRAESIQNSRLFLILSQISIHILNTNRNSLNSLNFHSSRTRLNAKAKGYVSAIHPFPIGNKRIPNHDSDLDSENQGFARYLVV